MLQRLGIRGKLLAVVMVPILVLLASVTYITATAVNDYAENSNAQKLIETLGEARATEALIQDERSAALNFVHLIQDTQDKLADARVEVAERYGILSERVAAADSAKADSLLEFTAGQLGVDGDTMLPEARALTLAAPEAEGGWLVMPTPEDVEAMDRAYASTVRQLDTLATSTAEELDLQIPFASLSYAVEQEAALAHTLFGESLAYQATFDETAPKVDAGLDQIRAAADQVEATEENKTALASVASGSELRETLPQIRAGVRAAAISPATVTAYYTQVINTFVGATDAVALAVPDRNVVATIQAYAALDELVERIRYEGDVFTQLIRQGTFTTTEATQARSTAERTSIALEEAQERGAGLPTALEVPALGASGEANTTDQSFTTIQNTILNGLDSSLVAARDSAWPEKVQAELDQYTPLRDEAWNRTTSAIQTNTDNALAATWLTLAAAVGAVVGSLIIAFAISRRIVNPLRRLTTTATAVREELPRLVERVAQPGEDVDVSEVQIAVESQDEIGRLAEAFNGVNAATIEIAREQAALRGSISEMFVNVARRDQLLLNRQLSSIDEMERTEDDPQRLTKLFALDHLATRMRRNSESLLVLAGIDTGRRIRRAMPMSDVVRTASSEIELYERIDLELNVDPAMLGHQALTAAHLFAELLENATVFSDPGSRVVVRTGRTVDGFTVEVVDTGIGMTPEELAEANARVQSSAASEILGAQRLGLFVVGRIARRLGAHVALSSVEGRGTVATVLLPSALFEAVGEPESAPAAAAPIAPALPAQPAPVQIEAPAVPPVVSAPSGTGLPTRGAAPAQPAPSEAPAAPAPTAPAAQPYAPASLVAGASLSGRAVEAADADDDSIPLPPGIQELIDADAAAAPVAEPVNGADLTSGTAASGLPTRRRRAESPAGAAGEDEAEKVIGLPVRATAAQLSALDAEAAAFTPNVSAAEVAPQTAEERSSVFRGFRSRREVEAPARVEPLPEVTPAVMADALGEPTDHEAIVEETPVEETPTRTLGGAFAAFDAMRRASAAASSEAQAEPVVEPVVEPVIELEPELEPEEPAAPALPSYSVPKLATSEIPTASLWNREPVADVDAEAAPERPAPFARSPYGAPFAAEQPVPVAAPMPAPAPEPVAAVEPETFTIPLLEPDEDEIALQAAEPEIAVEPEVAQEQLSQAAPVEAESPAAQEPVAHATPWAQAAPVEAAPVEAPVAPWQPASPWAAVAPVEVPEPQAAPAPQLAAEVAAEPVATEPEPSAPVVPVANEPEPFAPVAPEPEEAPEQAEQPTAPTFLDPAAFATAAAERDLGFPTTPVEEAPSTGVTDVALDDGYAVGGSSEPSLDDIIAQASGEEAGRAGFFGRLFGRSRREDEAEAAPATQARAPFAPISAEPTSFAPGAYQPPVPAPVTAPTPVQPFAPESVAAPASEPFAGFAPQPVAASEPEAFAPAPQQSFAPQSFAPEPQSSYAPQSFVPEPQQSFAPQEPVFEPQAGGASFSPEDLARATGWEAAGASALAAATSESAIGGYQPVIDTEHSSDRAYLADDPDMTTAVFSELSSLSELRPKVEKTKAGLQKRRSAEAAPVEVTPIAEEVTLTHKERDAEAVRSRFSSFYSGTQRARTDAAELDVLSTPQPASE